MKNFLHEGTCPIRDILSRLGDKWSLLVLTTLSANDMMRFSDIQKTIGDISPRMLTVTLRSLEADGLVVRKVYPEVPPRVEYCLDKSGHTLLPYLDSLVQWAKDNAQNIEASRQKYNGQKGVGGSETFA
jgi:DNA-binding HxlR family transcriptional regulator